MKINRVQENQEVFMKSDNLTIYRVKDESKENDLLDREQEPSS